MGSGSSVVLDPDGGIEAESVGRNKLPSSKFKGVVPQPNGRWGAQIYEKHRRVWLGTFNGEDSAAKSYDVAARRFRGSDAVTNFISNDGMEAAFLASHSISEIVDMLRKHTYAEELNQMKRKQPDRCESRLGITIRTDEDFGWGICQKLGQRERLFEKSVTPSDVGKLNRLVIPKQHAEKHFPLPNGVLASKGMLLSFTDSDSKVWRFRYSYWNSSQSYVLTKGWSRFVKEKNLNAGDIVTFRRSSATENQLFIDCKSRATETAEPGRMLRLFGVNIFKTPMSGGDVNGNGKRNREAPPLDTSSAGRIIAF